ncbi:MAG: ferritin-like domain-containing protein [Acidimicrobiales bacterium]|nr:ferritin-like domain-containing protein [Acidimicrobiales bacterium]
MTMTDPNAIDVNDPDRILEITRANVDPDEVVHAVKDNADALFTWDYTKGQRAALDKLYEKAKTSQWNGTTDLPWDTDVDLERFEPTLDPLEQAYYFDNPDSPINHMDEKTKDELNMESFKWLLSQFLHGEQGALLCTAKIVETVPWIDAKYYAATQVVDEARHVEVFSRYITEKLDGGYGINTHLGVLLDDIINDSRWDMTYLGMQIMVEGLALAAFGFMHQTTNEPLLKQLLRYVMADEARHVAFGVLSLQEVYESFSAAEIRERQEFAFDSALRMRDRFLRQEVWPEFGIDTREMVKFQLEMPWEMKAFQRLLFAKIVPNCRKLGLIDAGDGWLRDRFTEIGVIEYEHYEDTTDEYQSFELTDEETANVG